MSLGIGLGAFAGGFQKGYGLGQQMKTASDDRKFQKEIKSSYEDAQNKFQEGLAAGTYNEDQLMDVFRTESVPRIRDFLLKAGRVEDAMRWEQWGTSNKGTDYVKLYGKGRSQFLLGDHGGFTDSLNQMAKSAGLDYNFSHIAGNDSSPARIRVSSVDGKTVIGEYGTDDPRLPLLYEQLFNPPSGFHYQTQQTNRNTAKAPGITGFNDDKDEPTLSYEKAHKIEAESMDWGDISPDEQDERILRRMDRSRPSHYKQYKTTGITGEQKLIIDPRTGRPVGTPEQGQDNKDGNAGGEKAQSKPISDRFVTNDIPTTSEAALQLAQELSEAGYSDEDIAYGLSTSRLVDEENIPEKWRSHIAQKVTEEGMNRMDPIWGATKKGKDMKEAELADVDSRTRQGNHALGRQSILDKIVEAVRSKNIPLKEINIRMKEEGISIDELPRDIQRIMRDEAPGFWESTKEFFGLGDRKVTRENFLKEPIEDMIERFDATEYKSKTERERHKEEKRELELVKSGKMDAATLLLSITNNRLNGGKEYSKEFIEILKRMGHGYSPKNKDRADDMPGLGRGAVPIPRNKPSAEPILIPDL